MKKLISTIIISFISSVCLSQVHQEWVARYGMPQSPTESAYSCTVDNTYLTQYTFQNNFEYSISLEKNSFLEGELIYLSLKIKNISFHEDSIVNFDQGNIGDNIRIIDNDGKSLIYIAPNIDYSKLPTLKLKPEEEKIINIDIFNDFGYLSEGNYKIQYNSKKNKSNEIFVQILKPTGEDLLEYLEFIKYRHIEDSKVRYDSLYNFLINYPESRYYNLILRDFITIYLYEVTNEYLIQLLNIADTYIDKNPNSQFSIAIINLFKIEKQKLSSIMLNKIIILLNRLIQNYPNTEFWKESLKYFNE